MASTTASSLAQFPSAKMRCMQRIFADGNCAKELAVVLAIADFKRPNLTRPPSLAYLSFLAGCDEGEFDATLRQLESKGYAHAVRTAEGVEVSLQGLLDAIQRQTE